MGQGVSYLAGSGHRSVCQFNLILDQTLLVLANLQIICVSEFLMIGPGHWVRDVHNRSLGKDFWVGSPGQRPLGSETSGSGHWVTQRFLGQVTGSKVTCLKLWSISKCLLRLDLRVAAVQKRDPT